MIEVLDYIIRNLDTLFVLFGLVLPFIIAINASIIFIMILVVQQVKQWED